MSKSQPHLFFDEFLRSNGILDLDPAIQLHPAEAAVLLGTTMTGLECARKAGNLPPCRQTQPHAAVRYLLGDVLAARRLRRQASIAALVKARQRFDRPSDVRPFPVDSHCKGRVAICPCFGQVRGSAG